MTIEIECTLESVGDIDEAGNGLYRNYTLEITVGDSKPIDVVGWHQCGWISPGAHADIDGSGLALWGDSQHGGWSVTDGDGDQSGVPSVSVERNEHMDDVNIKIWSDAGGANVLTPEDIGIPYAPDSDDGNDTTEAAIAALAERIETALAEARPDGPSEPTSEEVFEGVDALDGFEDANVRVGRYLGSAYVRVAVKIDDDDYRDYDPAGCWEDSVRNAAASAAVAAIQEEADRLSESEA